MKLIHNVIIATFSLSLVTACGTQQSQNIPKKQSKAEAELAFAMQPNSFFEARLDEPQIVVEGQKLHPKLQYEFQERKKARAKSGIDYQEWLMEKWGEPDTRKWLRDETVKNWRKHAFMVQEAVDTKDLAIPGTNGDIRARLYRPADASSGPLPALVYFHGGGYLIASIEAVEPQAEIIATEADIVVISVDYALSPENKFPAAHIDALDAYDWIEKNAATLGIDASRIGVGGDSAGGNLAIVISDERARQGLSIPKAQLLYYPFTDSQTERFGSYDVFGDGYGLDKQFIRNAMNFVFEKPEDADHRWMAPLRLADLDKQPPAVIATAGFDPIRDQGALFATALQDHGVKVDYTHYPSLNHGFLEASAVIDDAKEACFDTARAIGRMLRDN